MEINSMTDNDQILAYADLREEYEHSDRNGDERSKILALAEKRYEKIKSEDIDEKTGGWKEDLNYDWY